MNVTRASFFGGVIMHTASTRGTKKKNSNKKRDKCPKNAPAAEKTLFDLNSPLFTDFTSKQSKDVSLFGNLFKIKNREPVVAKTSTEFTSRRPKNIVDTFFVKESLGERKKVPDRMCISSKIDQSLRKQGDIYKDIGNEYFRSENYETAIFCYGKAIANFSRNPIYYGNRAAAYFKLNKFKEAINDSRMATALDESYVKVIKIDF